MHVEAMNFSVIRNVEHTVALVSHCIYCSFDAIAWNNRQRNGVVFAA